MHGTEQRRRTITGSGVRKILVVAICGSIIAFLMSYFSPAKRQERNLQAAQHHADSIQPSIHADARFRDVTIGSFTGDGGCLWVFGSVVTETDRELLQKAVAATQPPVQTRFDVLVIPTTSNNPR